jgi:hypothetical protein
VQFTDSKFEFVGSDIFQNWSHFFKWIWVSNQSWCLPMTPMYLSHFFWNGEHLIILCINHTLSDSPFKSNRSHFPWLIGDSNSSPFSFHFIFHLTIVKHKHSISFHTCIFSPFLILHHAWSPWWIYRLVSHLYLIHCTNVWVTYTVQLYRVPHTT